MKVFCFTGWFGFRLFFLFVCLSGWELGGVIEGCYYFFLAKQIIITEAKP